MELSMIKSRWSWVVHNRGHVFSKIFTLQGCTTVPKRMFNRYCTKKHAIHGIPTRQLSLLYTESRKPPNLRLTCTRVRPILPYGLSVCYHALGRITSTSWGRDSTFASYNTYMYAIGTHNITVNVSPYHYLPSYPSTSCNMRMLVINTRTKLWPLDKV